MRDIINKIRKNGFCLQKMQAATARKTAAAKYEMELEFSGLESE